MLQVAERCYWKIQKNQYNSRKCNCRHKTSVPAGLSLTSKWAFFNDFCEPELIMSSRGEDKMRAFSFAHPLFYWILLFFRAGGWEVSAVGANTSHQVACAERVFLNQTLFFDSPSSPQIIPFWPAEEQRRWVQAAGAEAAWLRIQLWLCALAEPLCHPVLHLCRGAQGSAPLSIPLPGITVLSHTSKLPCAPGEIAATIWLAMAGSNLLVTQNFKSLYGFNFGK